MDKKTFEENGMRALKMAEYFLEDADIAWEAVENAFLFLPAKIGVQDKRGYHQVKSRRRKTLFNELEMLQFLTLENCSRREQEQEATRPLNQERLIKRYIKHVVLRTMPHTSFHVAVGLLRLVYYGSNQETISVFQVIQPHRDVEASTVSRAKAQLFADLKQRFAAYLRVEVGPNGEKRFTALPENALPMQLVEACLAELTPWGSTCGRSLREIDHLHRLIHPPCLRKTTAAGMPLKLRLPQLGTPMTTKPEANEKRRDHPAKRLRELRTRWRQLAHKRSLIKPTNLLFQIDGTRRIRWDLDGQSEFRLALEKSDRMLEIWGWSNREQIPLGFQLLPWPDQQEDVEELSPIAVGSTYELCFKYHPTTLALHLQLKPVPEPQPEMERPHIYRQGLLLRLRHFLEGSRRQWLWAIPMAMVGACLLLLMPKSTFREAPVQRNLPFAEASVPEFARLEAAVRQAHYQYAEALFSQQGNGDAALRELDLAKIAWTKNHREPKPIETLRARIEAGSQPMPPEIQRDGLQTEAQLRTAIAVAYHDYAFFLATNYPNQNEMTRRLLQQALPYDPESVDLLSLSVVVAERLGLIEEAQQLRKQLEVLHKK